MKVAVVGGGWAGLTAAVDLTAGGANVTLFEAGRLPGGRARTVFLDDQRRDNGQHILLGAYQETLAIMRTVGADPDRLLARYPLQVCEPGRFHLALPRWPAPFNVAWGLLAARGVGLGEKLRTALWMQTIQRRRFRLEKDVSVAEWLDQAGQNGRLRSELWEPLCLAALNCPAERASAQIFANVLRDSLGSPRRENTDLLLPRRPLGEIFPEPAIAWLAAHDATLNLGHRVGEIETDDSQLHVSGEIFDRVVVATAPQHAARLLKFTDDGLDHEPIATIYLQAGADKRLAFPLQKQSGGIGQWVVDRGNGLFACVLSGHGPWEALSDDALASSLATELGLDAASCSARVIREKRATFACRPNLVRPDWRTDDPRIVLAGDYTWAEYPATLEGAVRSGRRAAHALLGKSYNSPQ